AWERSPVLWLRPGQPSLRPHRPSRPDRPPASRSGTGSGGTGAWGPALGATSAPGKKKPRTSAWLSLPLSDPDASFDGQAFCLSGRLLRQYQLKHTVSEFCRGTGFVDVLAELEAAGNFPVVTLGTKHAPAVTLFLFLLAFCADCYGLAVDIDVNVFLRDAGQLCHHGEVVSVFLHIHAHFRRTDG